jgi:tetratricopeptide (TPR) repeat protein
LYSARLTVILWRGGRALSRVVFKISAGFLVGVLVLLAGSLYLSDRYLSEYRRLAAAGDMEGAMQRARLAARLDPFSSDALETLSLVLQLQDRDKEAADALREAIERDPNNYEPYLLLGNLQTAQLGRFDAAAESYRDGLRLNPNADEARRALAQLLIREGDLEAAKKEYEKLKEEERISYLNLYDLGRIYVRTGEPREGLRTLQRARRMAAARLQDLEALPKLQQRELIKSMDLAIADALVVQRRYAEAREVIARNSSEQAPALLQLISTDPEGYRESVVNGGIY